MNLINRYKLILPIANCKKSTNDFAIASCINNTKGFTVKDVVHVIREGKLKYIETNYGVDYSYICTGYSSNMTLIEVYFDIDNSEIYVTMIL